MGVSEHPTAPASKTKVRWCNPCVQQIMIMPIRACPGINNSRTYFESIWKCAWARRVGGSVKLWIALDHVFSNEDDTTKRTKHKIDWLWKSPGHNASWHASEPVKVMDTRPKSVAATMDSKVQKKSWYLWKPRTGDYNSHRGKHGQAAIQNWIWLQHGRRSVARASVSSRIGSRQSIE